MVEFRYKPQFFRRAYTKHSLLRCLQDCTPSDSQLDSPHSRLHLSNVLRPRQSYSPHSSPCWLQQFRKQHHFLTEIDCIAEKPSAKSVNLVLKPMFAFP